MRVKFKKGKQRELLTRYKLLKKCSWRKLVDYLNVDWKTVRRWRDENHTLPFEVMEKIVREFPELRNLEQNILEIKHNNWGQVKGAKKLHNIVRKKLKTDIEYRKRWIEKCRIGGINNIKRGLIKNWDIGFRNIGRRKFIGPTGEKMFTKTEKEIAEIFVKNNIEYEYEPKIIFNGNNYFPDFRINCLLIEHCGLLSRKYFHSLKKKLKDYMDWKGKVILIIPKKNKKTLRKRVRINKKYIIFIEDKNLSELIELVKKISGVENDMGP